MTSDYPDEPGIDPNKTGESVNPNRDNADDEEIEDDPNQITGE
jgi:hypothetical protein